jgi:hypothetical protein
MKITVEENGVPRADANHATDSSGTQADAHTSPVNQATSTGAAAAATTAPRAMPIMFRAPAHITNETQLGDFLHENILTLTGDGHLAFVLSVLFVLGCRRHAASYFALDWVPLHAVKDAIKRMIKDPTSPPSLSVKGGGKDGSIGLPPPPASLTARLSVDGVVRGNPSGRWFAEVRQHAETGEHEARIRLKAAFGSHVWMLSDGWKAVGEEDMEDEEYVQAEYLKEAGSDDVKKKKEEHEEHKEQSTGRTSDEACAEPSLDPKVAAPLADAPLQRERVLSGCASPSRDTLPSTRQKHHKLFPQLDYSLAPNPSRAIVTASTTASSIRKLLLAKLRSSERLKGAPALVQSVLLQIQQLGCAIDSGAERAFEAATSVRMTQRCTDADACCDNVTIYGDYDEGYLALGGSVYGVLLGCQEHGLIELLDDGDALQSSMKTSNGSGYACDEAEGFSYVLVRVDLLLGVEGNRHLVVESPTTRTTTTTTMSTMSTMSAHQPPTKHKIAHPEARVAMATAAAATKAKGKEEGTALDALGGLFFPFPQHTDAAETSQGRTGQESNALLERNLEESQQPMTPAQPPIGATESPRLPLQVLIPPQFLQHSRSERAARPCRDPVRLKDDESLRRSALQFVAMTAMKPSMLKRRNVLLNQLTKMLPASHQTTIYATGKLLIQECAALELASISLFGSEVAPELGAFQICKVLNDGLLKAFDDAAMSNKKAKQETVQGEEEKSLEQLEKDEVKGKEQQSAGSKDTNPCPPVAGAARSPLRSRKKHTHGAAEASPKPSLLQRSLRELAIEQGTPSRFPANGATRCSKAAAVPVDAASPSSPANATPRAENQNSFSATNLYDTASSSLPRGQPLELNFDAENNYKARYKPPAQGQASETKTTSDGSGNVNGDTSSIHTDNAAKKDSGSSGDTSSNINQDGAWTNADENLRALLSLFPQTMQQEIVALSHDTDAGRRNWPVQINVDIGRPACVRFANGSDAVLQTSVTVKHALRLLWESRERLGASMAEDTREEDGEFKERGAAATRARLSAATAAPPESSRGNRDGNDDTNDNRVENDATRGTKTAHVDDHANEEEEEEGGAQQNTASKKDVNVSLLFSSDTNPRVGIPGTLHRISALHDKRGEVLGLTYKLGRALNGCAGLIKDVLAALIVEQSRKSRPAFGAVGGQHTAAVTARDCGGWSATPSLLVIGPPGTGKSTLLRDISRMMADEFEQYVVVVDSCNEIGGEGSIPHPGKRDLLAYLLFFLVCF